MKEFVEILGQQIAYEVTGTGEKKALILHGWGTNLETMGAVVRVLAPTHTVYAYDAPGFGDSCPPREIWGTEDYARLCEAFAKHFHLEGAVAIGHSFGGKTLSIVGSTSPDLFSRLVLIDASGVAPKRGLSYHIKVRAFKAAKALATLPYPKEEREERLKEFYRRHGSSDYRDSEGIMRKVFVKVVNENTTSYFPHITAPTLLIWGDKDEDTPLWMGKVFEEKIPDAGLVVLSGGHYAFAEDYNTFASVLQSFTS